jgi:protein-disulfide isomerase
MPILEQVLETNSPHVKVVFKQFPLKMHKAAALAAAASLVAHEEGKFWEFHSLMMENFRKLSNEEIANIAKELGFDGKKFHNQIEDIKVLKKIKKDIDEGLAAGVRGVPKIFINGRPLQNRSVKGFQKIIDMEMKRLDIQSPEVNKD